jgi:type III pantothenate kinase
MILCLDSGNTRIKWGLHDGRQWLAHGALQQADARQLQALTDTYPPPAQILLANVAGDQAVAAITHHLQNWGVALTEIQSAPRQAGVTNLYQNPAQLGVDRWCALLAAWQLRQQACVVVMAGTATTIDTLDQHGNFLGGFILPGSALMRHALCAGTADLQSATGTYKTYPRTTHEAIHSGLIEAQAGAIERAFHRLDGDQKSCILSGGNAPQLVAHLAIAVTLAHNLPLEGLVAIWREDHKESITQADGHYSSR